MFSSGTFFRPHLVTSLLKNGSRLAWYRTVPYTHVSSVIGAATLLLASLKEFSHSSSILVFFFLATFASI